MAWLNALIDDGPFSPSPGDGDQDSGTIPTPGSPTTPAPPPTTPGGDSGSGTTLGSGAGGGGKGGGGYDPLAALGGRPQFSIGDAPDFSYPEFRMPTFDEAFSEPGYQFRLKSGTDALERSAAARGVHRTGGTLKNIIEFGQNFGMSEYDRSASRALSIWDANRRNALDMHAPRMATWNMKSLAEREAALAQYGRQWDIFQFQNRPGPSGPFDPEPKPEDFGVDY